MISSLLPAALNHLLSQEPKAVAMLSAHAGKVACIDTGLMRVRFKVAGDGMLQAAEDKDEPNVTIRVKLADLPLIAQFRERAFSYVRIEGDADFANTVSQLSRTLRWDAEEDLSRMVGDIAVMRFCPRSASLPKMERNIFWKKIRCWCVRKRSIILPAMLRVCAMTSSGSPSVSISSRSAAVCDCIDRLALLTRRKRP